MPAKNYKIINVINYLKAKYGTDNILVKDHWDSDQYAIGLADKTGKYLAYISTVSEKDNDYYLALENPPTDNEFPYSPAGEFNGIGLTKLEELLAKHLCLIK